MIEQTRLVPVLGPDTRALLSATKRNVMDPIEAGLLASGPVKPPSRPLKCRQWLFGSRFHDIPGHGPVTAAGLRPIFTAFPLIARLRATSIGTTVVQKSITKKSPRKNKSKKKPNKTERIVKRSDMTDFVSIDRRDGDGDDL